MKPTTPEWVAKAEGDFLTAGRSCERASLRIMMLQENEKHIPKIHNLIEWMLFCEEIDSSFEMRARCVGKG